MGGPWLWTSRTTWGSVLAVTRTGLPGSPCCSALPMRFDRTWPMRPGSHLPRRSPSEWNSAGGRYGWIAWNSESNFWHNSFRSIWRGVMGIPFPMRVRVRSSRSSTIRAIRSPLRNLRGSAFSTAPAPASRRTSRYRAQGAAKVVAEHRDELIPGPVHPDHVAVRRLRERLVNRLVEPGHLPHVGAACLHEEPEDARPERQVLGDELAEREPVVDAEGRVDQADGLHPVFLPTAHGLLRLLGAVLRGLEVLDDGVDLRRVITQPDPVHRAGSRQHGPGERLPLVDDQLLVRLHELAQLHVLPLVLRSSPNPVVPRAPAAPPAWPVFEAGGPRAASESLLCFRPPGDAASVTGILPEHGGRLRAPCLSLVAPLTGTRTGSGPGRVRNVQQLELGTVTAARRQNRRCRSLRLPDPEMVE